MVILRSGFSIMDISQNFDIEDELASIWLKAYKAIIDYLLSTSPTNNTIELNSCIVKSVYVDADGLLFFTDYSGKTSFAEDFEDYILYEVCAALRE